MPIPSDMMEAVDIFCVSKRVDVTDDDVGDCEEVGVTRPATTSDTTVTKRDTYVTVGYRDSKQHQTWPQ